MNVVTRGGACIGGDDGNNAPSRINKAALATPRFYAEKKRILLERYYIYYVRGSCNHEH